MQKFVFKPSVELIPGVIVTKETTLEYEREGIKQTVKDLVLHTSFTQKGEGYDTASETNVYLEEGDILVFEEDGRGYIKPANNTVVTIEKALADLETIKSLGGDDNVCSE